MIEFRAWPKTPRLFRDITITEKIDGTNAAVIIRPFTNEDAEFVGGPGAFVRVGDHLVGAQSRKRLIFPGDDNFGFAAWVYENAEALVEVLGDGYHYGEWWGLGIQRGYGMTAKRFSLFNSHRHKDVHEHPASPFELRTVPVLYQGPFSQVGINYAIDRLDFNGSFAAPGFMRPEGVIVYHAAAGQVFKALFENDGTPKGLVA